MFGAIINYWKKVGELSITVNQLYPFIEVEKPQPQEQIRGHTEDRAAETLSLKAGTQLREVEDEFYTEYSDNKQ